MYFCLHAAEKALEPPPPPPKGPATLALEAYIAKGPPKFQHNGMLTVFEKHGAQVCHCSFCLAAVPRHQSQTTTLALDA